jgi:nucleotide-binding universal stress UspA family protein
MFPETIIVPLDGSDFAATAVPIAAALVQPRAGRLVLVTTRWDSDANEPQEYLEKTAGTLDDVDVETVVIHDRSPAEAIEVTMRQEPGRLVCMTTHGRGRLRWAVLGSVAEQVIRAASDPVLLVGRHCATDWPTGARRSLLIGIDGSTPMPPVVAPAAEWAKALDLDVVVAMAIHPLDLQDPAATVDAVVGHLEDHGVRARGQIIRSTYPAGGLADLADDGGVQLIALSSHARMGAARVALGSVTMGVVGLARCPVLVTKSS